MIKSIIELDTHSSGRLTYKQLKETKFLFMNAYLSRAVDKVLTTSESENKAAVDHLIVADASGLRSLSTQAMEAVFAAENKMVVKEVDPQMAILEGIVAFAEMASQKSLLEVPQSTKEAVAMVALATAIALCGMATFIPSIQASPIGQPNTQQQSLFSSPSDKQALCGTVIAIDFSEEEFSVGHINPDTQQLELIPNKYNEITTPSYVRIVKFLDGTQEITVGKDAIDRPFSEREMAAVRDRRSKRDQWYKDNPLSTFNSSIPDLEFMDGFQPYNAYGLGWPPSFTIYFGFEEGMGGGFAFGIGSVGDEWEDELPKPIKTSYHGDYNATAQCVRTAEQLDRMEKAKRKAYELRQTVAKILLDRAKDMAETRLDAKVKYVVITIPSFTSADKRYPQPETTIDAVSRTGLISVKILDQSEAAVLAYAPMISQVERTANGRPQTVVMYYLNEGMEGISVFETYRAEPEEFLQLKMVAKYHFFQTVEDRMTRLLELHLYEKYTKGLYFNADKPFWEDPEYPAEPSVHPLDKSSVLGYLAVTTQRSRWVRSWAPDSGDVEERFYISEWDYVLFSHREWWDFEKAFLKKHFSRMLNRAYEKSHIKPEDQPEMVDFFLVVDQSRFRNSSSAIMKEALGGKAEELVDPSVESKFAATHGAARLAEYLTKHSSREPCK
ncbi:hypothetical protein BGZ95_001109 [Linnemannia exigua]|uniref:Uncharacterized protein n=1 Tax=Linnemannia exigua TaxID=604196 RepID=A0AAD4H563_9FUNG|nr:hypothetical protein BGZ95_001109 [Linnemannia exigua]